MSLDALSPDLVAPVLMFIGGLMAWFTTRRKNENDKEIEERKIEGASWEPLFETMQEFFQKQIDYQNQKIEDQGREIKELKHDSELNKLYRQDLDEQIRALRTWLGDSKDAPKVETFEEWYARRMNTGGVGHELK